MFGNTIPDEILRGVVLTGAFVGSVIAAVMSRRAGTRSESVERELNGPANELSLRELVRELGSEMKSHRLETSTSFTALNKRLDVLETAVFTEMATRVSRLEGSMQILTSPAVALSVSHPKKPSKEI